MRSSWSAAAASGGAVDRDLLAASGVGHIHHRADAGRRRMRRCAAAAAPPPAPVAGPARHAATSLAAPLRGRYPTVRVAPAGRAPAPDDRACWPATGPRSRAWPRAYIQRPDPAPGGRRRSRASGRRPAGVAGPIELPVLRAPAPDRRRSGLADRSPGSWPASATRAPALLTAAAACLAAGQVLDHIDGVGAPARSTAPWNGGPAIRRRAAGPGRSIPSVAAARP